MGSEERSSPAVAAGRITSEAEKVTIHLFETVGFLGASTAQAAGLQWQEVYQEL